MEQSEAFRILASADRQLLLDELLTRDGTATEEDLARQVAARRHKIAPDSISENQIKTARVRLAHNHLPYLMDLGVIDWNDREVALTDDECVDELFEAAQEFNEWPPDDLQLPLS